MRTFRNKFYVFDFNWIHLFKKCMRVCQTDQSDQCGDLEATEKWQGLLSALDGVWAQDKVANGGLGEI
jgi:hypothetical protein